MEKGNRGAGLLPRTPTWPSWLDGFMCLWNQVSRQDPYAMKREHTFGAWHLLISDCTMSVHHRIVHDDATPDIKILSIFAPFVIHTTPNPSDFRVTTSSSILSASRNKPDSFPSRQSHTLQTGLRPNPHMSTVPLPYFHVKVSKK